MPIQTQQMHQRLASAAAICILLLSGCNVGPRYIAPALPAPPAFKESSPAAYSAAPPGTWQPAQPQDAVLKGKWWEMFNEPELNALEDQLNINNQNIAQYFQNFMAARAQVSEARAGYFPTVTANPAFIKSGTGGPSAAAAVSSGTGTGSGGHHWRWLRPRHQYLSADRCFVGAGPMGPHP